MTLPVSPNLISLALVNQELGGISPYNQLITMNDRLLAGVSSVSASSWSISSLHGKSNVFNATFAVGTHSNINLSTWATAQGWNGSAQLVVTIPTGANIISTSTATAALTINGSFPSTVRVTNNGNIIGKGGTGQNGDNAAGSGLSAGGPALSVSSAVTFYNYGTIGGGGGGGGSSGPFGNPYGHIGGGGGAGFGVKGWGTYWTPPGPGVWWTSGSGDGTLLAPTATDNYWAAGVLSKISGGSRPVKVGRGGALGAAGGTSEYAYSSYDGSPMGGQHAGAGGGAAVVGNVNITWGAGATGTRYGTIS